MLKLSYIEFNILLPFFFFFFSGWFFFFKTNFFNIKIRRENTAILRYSNILQIQQPLSLIKWWLLNSLYLLFFLFTFKGITTIIWWNNFKINNFILLLVFFLFFILFIFFFFLLFLKSNIDTYTIDYFFSILNLSSILPIFFFTNNFFTFFFILEVSSCFVFYKFINSKLWYKLSKQSDTSKIVKNTFTKKYLNVLFFQYWATFLSSTVLLLVLLNFLYILGTSDWSIINSLLLINSNIAYFSSYGILNLMNFFFLFALFIKLGFTPAHLFKIEIYKGIQLISIFFYTTFYFLVFFIYFLFIFFIYLTNFFIQFWFIVFIFFILGVIYIIALLFDVTYLKAFFAYSTIINAAGFFGVALALLN